MTGGLCEKLKENQKAKSILQRLVHEHCFTSRRGLLTVSYELHLLFRQFLLAQIRENWEFTGSPLRVEFKKKQSKRKRTVATQVAETAALSTGDETLDLLLQEGADDPQLRALQAGLLEPDEDDEFYDPEDDSEEAAEPVADVVGEWDDDDDA